MILVINTSRTSHSRSTCIALCLKWRGRGHQPPQPTVGSPLISMVSPGTTTSWKKDKTSPSVNRSIASSTRWYHLATEAIEQLGSRGSRPLSDDEHRRADLHDVGCRALGLSYRGE